MDTIVCPRCGVENPDDVVNCKECRINLKWASENLEVDDSVKQSQEVLTGAQIERSTSDWRDKISIGCSSLLGLILFVLLVILSPLRNTAGLFLPFLSSFGFLLGWGIAYFIVKKRKPTIKQVVIVYVIGILLGLIFLGLPFLFLVLYVGGM
jgi:hypothetical protein